MATDEETLEALHVVVDNSTKEKDVAADWGSWQTFQVAPGTPPQQILPQNNKRKESEIVVQAVASNGVSNTATVVAPAAGSTITSLVLQPGQYNISWVIGLGPGAGAAGDVNNCAITLNGVQQTVSVNGSTNTSYPQANITVLVTVPNSTLAIIAIGVGTAGLTYRAAITATPTGVGASIRVGTRAQVMNGQGGLLQAGRYPYEAKQELWMGSDGISTMIVTVLDERYE